MKFRCPQPSCAALIPHTMKRGFYVTQWNHQRVRRYQCHHCRKHFSTHTFKSTYRQKKPYVNEQVFRCYCSAVTQRRTAKLLHLNPKTVVRKFLILAELARKEHEKRTLEQAPRPREVFFDELLSFEHTRLKPLSIALAVDPERRILDVSVAQSHYQGRLSSIAMRKYGPRPDESHEARKSVLSTLQTLCASGSTIVSDRKPQYEKEIREALPGIKHEQVENRGSRLLRLLNAKRRNEKDRMFALNHVAALIRHDLSRMLRKVWVTTKKKQCLEQHLMLYVAYHNGYDLFS